MNPFRNFKPGNLGFQGTNHLPFVKRGVPSVDIIDLDYGPNNSYHHTAEDTLDKISAKSLTIDGDVFLETIRLVNQR